MRVSQFIVSPCLSHPIFLSPIQRAFWYSGQWRCETYCWVHILSMKEYSGRRSEEKPQGYKHIIGIFVVGSACDALLHEIGIIAPFHQIEPPSFNHHIRADSPGQAQIEFRSKIVPGLSGLILKSSSD